MTTNRRLEEIEGQLDDLWFWLFVIGGLLGFSIWLFNSGRLTTLQSSSSEQSQVTTSSSSEPFKPSKHAPKFIYPHSNPYPITSGFGMRLHPISKVEKLHAGIDFGSPIGTEIKAVAEGKITVAGWINSSCGNGIVIEHSGNYSSHYCHLSQVLSSAGQSVKSGTVNGLS